MVRHYAAQRRHRMAQLQRCINGTALRLCNDASRLKICCNICPTDCSLCPSSISLSITNCVLYAACQCGNFTLEQIGSTCVWKAIDTSTYGWYLKCFKINSTTKGWFLGMQTTGSLPGKPNCIPSQEQLTAAQYMNVMPLVCCPELPASGSRSIVVNGNTYSFDWAFS